MPAKAFFRNFTIFTVTSLLVFVTGAALGMAIVFMNKYLDLEYIPNEFLLISWSIWWGLSAYSRLFKSENGKYIFRLRMCLYTLAYGTGVYLALFKGEGLTSANLFAGFAILGLLMVITAPPFIEKI